MSILGCETGAFSEGITVPISGRFNGGNSAHAFAESSLHVRDNYESIAIPQAQGNATILCFADFSSSRNGAKVGLGTGISSSEAQQRAQNGLGSEISTADLTGDCAYFGFFNPGPGGAIWEYSASGGNADAFVAQNRFENLWSSPGTYNWAFSIGGVIGPFGFWFTFNTAQLYIVGVNGIKIPFAFFNGGLVTQPNNGPNNYTYGQGTFSSRNYVGIGSPFYFAFQLTGLPNLGLNAFVNQWSCVFGGQRIGF